MKGGEKAHKPKKKRCEQGEMYAATKKEAQSLVVCQNVLDFANSMAKSFVKQDVRSVDTG